MDVVKTALRLRRPHEAGPRRRVRHGGRTPRDPGSELARELFPVSGRATGPDRTVVDVTFHGATATRPVISQLARTYNIDISILGAAMDTVGGSQIGRMRIELPGRYEDNVVPVGFLREQGLQVDPVDSRAPAPPRSSPPPWPRKVPSDLVRDAARPARPGHPRHPLHGAVGHRRLRPRRTAARHPPRPHRQGRTAQEHRRQQDRRRDREHRPLTAVHHPADRADPFTTFVVGTFIGPYRDDRPARRRRHPVLRAPRRDRDPRGRPRPRRSRPVHGRLRPHHRPQGPAAAGPAVARLRRHHHRHRPHRLLRDGRRGRRRRPRLQGRHLRLPARRHHLHAGHRRDPGRGRQRRPTPRRRRRTAPRPPRRTAS